MWDPSNMFLNGPYAPWREEGEAFDLEIEGQLPEGLSGALFRVGPSPLFRPQNPSRYHWFDGDGMVHGLFLRDGRAAYRNRYVQTAGLKEEKELGRSIYGGFMNGRDTPLPPGKFPNNPANTHVQLYGDRLLAFCEGYPPRELRPDTLETVSEQYNFRGGVVGPLTAHHKVDPTNGDFLTFGNMDGAITWYRADSHGNILDRHSVDLGFPALTHDYAVTTDYAIWLVSPATARFERIMNGQPSTVWEPEKLDQCRWAVMHRRTGEVTWVEASDAFSTSHFLNAYQDGTKIIVDGHRVGQFGPTLKDLESPPPGGDWNWWFKEIITTPWRWELDLTTGKSRDIEVTEIQGEFPRINDQRAGLSHQYGYYTTTRGAGDWFTDGLAKHDYRTGETSMQTLDGVLTSPGEAVFVPRPGAQAEDDGWLLSIWWDPTTDRSEVIVQEAQDFTGTPIARIKLNHRVPMGFHGSWSDAAELDAAVRGA